MNRMYALSAVDPFLGSIEACEKPLGWRSNVHGDEQNNNLLQEINSFEGQQPAATPGSEHLHASIHQANFIYIV